LLAFILLTGIRDGAVASLKIKHVNLTRGEVDLDAREVKTKFAKSFRVCFFPVGGDAGGIVEQWVTFLRETKNCSIDDPLFPATAVVNRANRQFQAAGLSKSIGRTRHLFGRSSAMPLPLLGCRISTRTPSARRLCNLVSGSARGLSNSKRGYRTWAMKMSW
jgi:integrase